MLHLVREPDGCYALCRGAVTLIRGLSPRHASDLAAEMKVAFP
jgi:hypothetical protein